MKFLTFEDRLSDSPFVERIWRCRSGRAGTFLSVAASHWEMVVTRVRGRTMLALRGPETKATSMDWAYPNFDNAETLVKHLVRAVHAAGYFDQAHLTRSRRRLIGETPGQVRRRERQLSFLYK